MKTIRSIFLPVRLLYMCEELNYKYITKEEISVAYFQFPKFLFKYPISQNGKVVYMLLYDRARLSQMNNWLDENGRSYKQPLNSLYVFSYSVRSKQSRERSPRERHHAIVLQDMFFLCTTQCPYFLLSPLIQNGNCIQQARSAMIY